MNKTTKIVLGIIVLALVVWGITAVASKKQPSTASNTATSTPIKIGAIYGFTGTAATWADMGRKADELAVKEINAAGGINGQPLQIIYEDGQTTPAKDVSAFNKLVSTDGVKIVVGDVWSFITNPLIPLADAQKVTLISPTVMDESVDGASPYFFSTGHTIASQQRSIDAFFELNKDVKTISVVCWNDNWGKTNLAQLLASAKAHSVKIASQECTNDFGSTYQSEMTKVKQANPDAIYFSTALPDVVLRKIKDIGLGSKKVLTGSLAVDAIEVNKTPLSYLKNVWFTNWTPGADFAAKFKAAYGVAPIMEAQNHYDTIRAIAMALRAGGDFDSALKKVKFASAEGYSFDFTSGDQIRINSGKTDLYTYDGQYHIVSK